MQLMTILNRLEKQSGFVYGEGKWRDNAIEIELKPRKGSKPICSGCGKKRPGYDRLPTRRFEYVPPWQLAVFLWTDFCQLAPERYQLEVFQKGPIRQKWTPQFRWEVSPKPVSGVAMWR